MAQLPAEQEARCLPRRWNRAPASEGLEHIDARALLGLLPAGKLGDAAVAMLGERFLAAETACEAPEITQSEEAFFCFSEEAARQQRRHGLRFVQLVFETLPLFPAARDRLAIRNRQEVFCAIDLVLPIMERAALALRLEGVRQHSIEVCP